MSMASGKMVGGCGGEVLWCLDEREQKVLETEIKEREKGRSDDIIKCAVIRKFSQAKMR